MQIQSSERALLNVWVVICFKFSNFAYANTVRNILHHIFYGLLFALNLVTLLMQIQSNATSLITYLSCYLL